MKASQELRKLVREGLLSKIDDRVDGILEYLEKWDNCSGPLDLPPDEYVDLLLEIGFLKHYRSHYTLTRSGKDFWRRYEAERR